MKAKTKCKVCGKEPDLDTTVVNDPTADVDQVRRGRVVEGREYLGNGCWCHLNMRENGLRDEKT